MTDDISLDELPQPEYEGRVDPEALETDGDNPNEMTDEQFGLLVDRMRQNGWLGGPIITTTDGLIADGEHRWRAAQDIGLSEVPVRQYDIDDAIELWDAVVGELRRVLTDDGHLYAFADWRTEHAFRLVLENYGFDIRNVLVWDKGSMGLGGVDTVNYRTQYELCIFATLDNPRMLETRGPDVHEHERTDTDTQAHPTEKPVGLVARYVNNSTHEGDTVLDPFMGSGTTAVAAIQNDRDYIGFEIDEENYRNVIERRIGEAKRQVDAGINDT